MRYQVREGDEASITLPRALIEQLGHPEEAEVMSQGGSLVVWPASADLRMGHAAEDLAAIDAYRARHAAGIVFTEEELAELRAASREAETRESEQILASFRDGDLSA